MKILQLLLKTIINIEKNSFRKKNQEKKEIEEQEKAEKEKREKEQKDDKSGRRSSLRRYSDYKGKEPPKSMVTYEKGPPREIGGKDTIDKREHGLSHES